MTEAARQFQYTWDDYRQWPDGERWEIIDGEAYEMSPAPSPRHQMIASRLISHLHGFFRGKRCLAFVSPIDVKFSETDTVQPDLVVVCNREQITETHIEGAPTLVVEILSPSTTLHDRLRKRTLYARCGVQEYWIVTPFPSLVEVLVLQQGKYVIQAAYEKTQTLESAVFPDLRVELSDVFDFPLEPGEEPPRKVREPPPHYAAP